MLEGSATEDVREHAIQRGYPPEVWWEPDDIDVEIAEQDTNHTEEGE